MLKVKCVQKFRDKNNVIIGYRIIDQNGNTKDVSSESLKQVIQQGRLEVINLTLTSDNRLIDKGITQTPTQQTQKSIKQSPQEAIDIEKMLQRLKLLGCATEIDTNCDHTIYLAKISEEDYRLVIPDDVTEIKFDYRYDEPTPISKIPIESSNAKLTVYGGNNLEIAEGLFQGTKFSTIDLRKFNTSKVTDMSEMFCDCKATSLDLSNFDNSKVTDMSYMFYHCRATSINLSNFDTSKVTNMSGMFCHCRATSINLSNFDTSKVTNMSGMFCYSLAASLDLSNFDTSNVTNMAAMFRCCEVTSLDLSNFDTSNVINMKFIFFGCKATSIELSSFDTSNVTSMYGMFYDCQATSINLGGNKDLESAWSKRFDL